MSELPDYNTIYLHSDIYPHRPPIYDLSECTPPNYYLISHTNVVNQPTIIEQVEVETEVETEVEVEVETENSIEITQVTSINERVCVKSYNKCMNRSLDNKCYNFFDNINTFIMNLLPFRTQPSYDCCLQTYSVLFCIIPECIILSCLKMSNYCCRYFCNGCCNNVCCDFCCDCCCNNCCNFCGSINVKKCCNIYCNFDHGLQNCYGLDDGFVI